MATNDNRAMVEAAEDILRMEQISSTQWRVLSVKMVDFAALAVAAERTRIAGELDAISTKLLTKPTVDGLMALDAYIDKLRGATDE